MGSSGSLTQIPARAKPNRISPVREVAQAGVRVGLGRRIRRDLTDQGQEWNKGHAPLGVDFAHVDQSSSPFGIRRDQAREVGLERAALSRAGSRPQSNLRSGGRCRTPSTAPAPVPFPVSLVVKNGSNRRRWSPGHPAAGVGDGEHDVRPPHDRLLVEAEFSRSTSSVSIVTVPPPGMASLALTTRFITTCSIWPRSASARERPGASSSATSMCSPISRRACRSCR